MYSITEEQFLSVMRLCDAARLLDAGLPATYTTTPIGALADLTNSLDWIVFIRPAKGPVRVEGVGD